MGVLRTICASLAMSFAAAGCSLTAPRLEAVPMPPIAPDSDYGKGVSALAAGCMHGMLVAAGGANFPDTPAAQGGKKRFYDEIYMLPEGSDTWALLGRLPERTAYGAVFQLEDRIVIAGGAGPEGSQKRVTGLTLSSAECDDERCDGVKKTLPALEPLAPLPKPVEQAGAAHDGSRLYVVGGLSDGEPSTAVYCCDVASANPRWEQVAEIPEPAVQPIAAICGGRLYVWGGFDPVKRVASDRGRCLDNGVWREVDGLPDGGTAVGTTVVQQADGRLWAVGGVNREIFNRALNLPPDKNAEYLSQPVGYYRFRPTVMTFDPAAERWTEAGTTAAAARAGAAVVLNGGRLTIIGGEIKPGIRSAQVNAIALPTNTNMQ